MYVKANDIFRVIVVLVLVVAAVMTVVGVALYVGHMPVFAADQYLGIFFGIISGMATVLLPIIFHKEVFFWIVWTVVVVACVVVVFHWWALILLAGVVSLLLLGLMG